MQNHHINIGTNIEKAITTLKAGKLLGLPTETVYGLAANALNEQAVLSIFEAKQRPHFDPLICHVSSVAQIADWVTEFPSRLKDLAEAFMPGPLTLLLPKRAIIPDLVTSGLDHVAVRVPAHPVAQSVLEQLDFPVAAPSANPFGYISPTTARHVADQLGDKVDYILDGGPCAVGLESTIVGLEEGIVTVYRLGGISLEALQQVVGRVEVQLNQSSNPKAPGQLKSHYAPRKPLIFCAFDEVEQHIDTNKKQVFIGFDRYTDALAQSAQVLLSRDGNFREAAQNLFTTLRTFDASAAEEIIAVVLPENDLGRAINDRLRRAARPS
jgi:L-threonylcarbamoyladenylate synthase